MEWLAVSGLIGKLIKLTTFDVMSVLGSVRHVSYRDRDDSSRCNGASPSLGINCLIIAINSGEEVMCAFREQRKPNREADLSNVK